MRQTPPEPTQAAVPAPDPADELATVLRYYREGWFTCEAAASSLVSLAATMNPGDILGALPEELVEAIRKKVETPPASPEAMLFVHGHVPMRYESAEEELLARVRADMNRRKAQHAFFKGAWAMHRYFAEDRRHEPG